MVKANSSLKYWYGAPSVRPLLNQGRQCRKRRRTRTLSKSSSQSPDEEPSSTQSTIPVPTVSDDLGFLVTRVNDQSQRPESTTAPSASRFKSTSCLRVLSFSSRTLNLPTVPKLPAAGLPTMISLCFISQQTGLNPTENLWDIIKRTMRDVKTRQFRLDELI